MDAEHVVFLPTAVTASISADNGTVVTINSNSLILATIQQNRPGVFVQAAVPTSTGFTIYLNKAVATKTTVAWFALTMPGRRDAVGVRVAWMV